VQHLDWNEVGRCENAAPPENASGEDRSGEAQVVEADVILAADVVYDPTLLPVLVGTICAILAHSDAVARQTNPTERPACQRQTRALVACERRSDETWRQFEDELSRRGLVKRDLSVHARTVAAKSDCPFFIPEESLQRAVLVELTLG